MSWQATLHVRLGTPADKQVMEVGAGVNPAVAFAALRHSRRVVATEGSPQALRLLERNVCANARSGVSVSNSSKQSLFLAPQCSRCAACSELLAKSCRTTPCLGCALSRQALCCNAPTHLET